MPETISQPNYGSFRTSVSVTTLRNIVLCSGLALPLLFLTSAARAELPTQLNVEGVIVSDGMVGDETVTIGIGLFPEPTGGIAKYTESFPPSGLYAIPILGP
jgi:hypothetical protein